MNNRRVAAAAVLCAAGLFLSGCLHRHHEQVAENRAATVEESTSQRAIHVALDIGHTPKVPGAIGADGTPEYEFNKSIVERITSALRDASNITVSVINGSGAEISLPDRSARAKSVNADLLLSVHHDSANDKYLTSREVDGRTLYSTDRFHGYSVFFSTRNPHAQDSRRFAELIGRAMRDQGFTPTKHHAEKIQGENRELVDPRLGVYRYDDLIVLRTAEMPAALLECGVIVNPSEEADLKTSERQAKIAAAVRQAITAMAVPQQQPISSGD